MQIILVPLGLRVRSEKLFDGCVALMDVGIEHARRSGGTDRHGEI